MSLNKILFFTVFGITTICCYTRDNYDINTLLADNIDPTNLPNNDNYNVDSYFTSSSKPIFNTDTTIFQQILHSSLVFFITLIQIIIIILTSLYFYFFINKKIIGNKIIHVVFLTLVIIMFLDWLLIVKEELDDISKVYLFVKDFLISIAVITIGFVIGDLTMKIKIHKKKIP